MSRHGRPRADSVFENRYRLRVLVDIADAGSLVGAAQINGVSQSNLSRLLGKLEGTARGKLFVRSQEGMRPTMLGAVAIDRARVILTEMQEADNALERVREAFGEGEQEQ